MQGLAVYNARPWNCRRKHFTWAKVHNSVIVGQYKVGIAEVEQSCWILIILVDVRQGAVTFEGRADVVQQVAQVPPDWDFLHQPIIILRPLSYRLPEVLFQNEGTTVFDLPSTGICLALLAALGICTGFIVKVGVVMCNLVSSTILVFLNGFQVRVIFLICGNRSRNVPFFVGVWVVSRPSFVLFWRCGAESCLALTKGWTCVSTYLRS